MVEPCVTWWSRASELRCGVVGARQHITSPRSREARSVRTTDIPDSVRGHTRRPEALRDPLGIPAGSVRRDTSDALLVRSPIADPVQLAHMRCQDKSQEATMRADDHSVHPSTRVKTGSFDDRVAAVAYQCLKGMRRQPPLRVDRRLGDEREFGWAHHALTRP